MARRYASRRKRTTYRKKRGYKKRRTSYKRKRTGRKRGSKIAFIILGGHKCVVSKSDKRQYYKLAKMMMFQAKGPYPKYGGQDEKRSYKKMIKDLVGELYGHNALTLMKQARQAQAFALMSQAGVPVTLDAAALSAPMTPAQLQSAAPHSSIQITPKKPGAPAALMDAEKMAIDASSGNSGGVIKNAEQLATNPAVDRAVMSGIKHFL